MSGKIKELSKKSVEALKNDGVKGFFVKAKNWTSFNLKKKHIKQGVKDILFINGCTINYCERYRVLHKMEELEAYGFSCDETNTGLLTEDYLRCYRGFVIYRAPHTPELEEFVKKAQSQNKVVFYDIDDLIFDLKYTKTIESLKEMSKAELDLYNDGVVRYGKMMSLCDYAITTTKVLKEEMKKHGKEACIDKNVASMEMCAYSKKAIDEVERDETKVVIGYASGSLTHNEDFELIKPALVKILKKYENVQLELVGALSLPDDLKAYEERITMLPFVDFTKLPAMIRRFDVNLAPLRDTLFNAAKSSIKWMEAGLVKVPTVASDVGDFSDSITDGKDGVLCKDDEWYETLARLVEDEGQRQRLGEGAYKTVQEKYTTVSNGKMIGDFIREKLHKNVYFMLPGVTVSGGILVAIKHAEILKRNGVDVTMINLNKETADVSKLECGDGFVNVLPYGKIDFSQHVDEMVATMWLTLPYVMKYPLCEDKRYLVQNRETWFYEMPDKRVLEANATYNESVKYLTISKWCEEWLKKDFGKKAKYAPNGIALSRFPFKERKVGGKVKVLIEGDPGSYYKNVDESFRIANKLDRSKYEVSFVSYWKEPKKWYKYDQFYNSVENDKMYKIYQEADILLKSSMLESFSYPPLEMMATGGCVVVAPNGGNKEYLKDGENCLFYELGNVDDALIKIEKLVSDEKLRKKLVENGRKTAEEREWEKIEKQIVELYS